MSISIFFSASNKYSVTTLPSIDIISIFFNSFNDSIFNFESDGTGYNFITFSSLSKSSPLNSESYSLVIAIVDEQFQIFEYNTRQLAVEMILMY